MRRVTASAIFHYDLLRFIFRARRFAIEQIGHNSRSQIVPLTCVVLTARAARLSRPATADRFLLTTFFSTLFCIFVRIAINAPA
jgi:hypothetical protein